MTSLSNKFCERAVNDIALATTIPIARTRLSRWLNGAGLRSEEMRREDVNDGRNHEKKEQGQVEDVPKPEEAFIECKSSGLLYRGDMGLLPVTPIRKQTLVCHYRTELVGTLSRQNVSASFFSCRRHPGYFAGPFTRTDDDSVYPL